MERFRVSRPKLLTSIAILSSLLCFCVIFVAIHSADMTELNQQISDWETLTINNLSCAQVCQERSVENEGMCCTPSYSICQTKQSCFDRAIASLNNQIDYHRLIVIYTSIPAAIVLVLLIVLGVYTYKLWKAKEQERRFAMQEALLQQPEENLENGFEEESFESYEEFIQYLIDAGYILPGMGFVVPKKRGDSKITDSFVTVDEQNCAICIMPFSQEKVLKLRCNHKFHSKCIRDWNQTNPSCPICRNDIYE